VKQHEFIAHVRRRGEYADAAQAEQVARTVLSVLGQRLGADEAEDLAAQLPGDLGDSLLAEAGPPQNWGRSEFVRELADALSTDEETAESAATAVLTTVAEAVTGGELNDVISRLPSGYAELFGIPELA
jgi:uncharacterized protein (DUF2267 family)